MNLHKRGWTEGLALQEFSELKEHNASAIKVRRSPLRFFCNVSSRTTDPDFLLPSASIQQDMLKLAELYTASVKEESTLTPQQLATRHVGKRDPKRHLEEAVEKAMGGMVVQGLGMGVLGEL